MQLIHNIYLYSKITTPINLINTEIKFNFQNLILTSPNKPEANIRIP